MTANTKPETKPFALKTSIIILMSVVGGVTVANLYYIQPLESQIASSFGVSQSAAGVAAMLTQLGYALGLLLFVPLGDMCERRSLIVRMQLVVIASLLAVAFSPSYPLLLASVFIMGITTIVPQIVLPYAAHLARPEDRGRTIGYIMSGLGTGVLLSRTFSGMLGAALGWRAVFMFAAGFVAMLTILVRFVFPSDRPSSSITYKELLRSIPGLVKAQRTLREASVNGFLMFGALNVFWTSLVFLLETPYYHMGAREAGLFGLVGAASTLAAPLVGRTADRKNPRFTLTIGITLAALAYLCLSVFGYNIWGLIGSVVLLDVGCQCAMISNQARVQALGDAIRSRNNTVYMCTYFLGGAAGTFFGTNCWQLFGWTGICAAGLSFLLIASVSHFIVYRRREAKQAAEA